MTETIKVVSDDGKAEIVLTKDRIVLVKINPYAVGIEKEVIDLFQDKKDAPLRGMTHMLLGQIMREANLGNVEYVKDNIHLLISLVLGCATCQNHIPALSKHCSGLMMPRDCAKRIGLYFTEVNL